MGKKEELKSLESKYDSCSLCQELCDYRTNVVFGSGDPDNCLIVIIGEAPGKNEDLQKTPFVGRSGDVLNSLLSDIGVKRSEVYITNTILCRPPENRNPTSNELRNCKSRLDKQISILKPKVVITLGNFATKYMLETKTGISALRGKMVEKNGIKIVPMFHPAVLLYSGNNPEKRQMLLDDFLVVKEILTGSSKRSKKQMSLNEF